MNRPGICIGLFMALIGTVLISLPFESRGQLMDQLIAIPFESSGQPMDGKALVAERCISCHTIDRIERRFGQPAHFWESTVDRMLGKRNMLNDEELRSVLDYLANPNY
ncbi:hypothetical protein OOT00_05370 [Desulfobotulus sp. H1]|uniref:Cytochrome c n=1 Tax=Desulfobotulus pelophilus TaxID=2823377 RepID=A0ABT3N7H3_9BACT|nr:hypothetical protein [Desulfobotulus pelophilus]MCW7753415.1 hypothetical protein [Desulfobotulus pelophilus]